MNKIPSNYGMCFHTFLFLTIQRSPNFVRFHVIPVILCYDYGTWRSVERKFDQNLVTSCTSTCRLLAPFCGMLVPFSLQNLGAVCGILVPFLFAEC